MVGCGEGVVRVRVRMFGEGVCEGVCEGVW